MSCEHQDQLIDLVYGEIVGAAADALRAEVLACDVCRDEFAGLEEAKALADQMPLLSAPSGLRSAIMAAAEAKAAGPGEGTAPTAAPTTERTDGARPAERPERVAEVIPLFRQYGTQVLVAAAACLLVVGIWFWPKGEDPIVSVVDPTSIESDPETEALAPVGNDEDTRTRSVETPLDPELAIGEDPESQTDDSTDSTDSTDTPARDVRTPAPDPDPPVVARVQRTRPANREGSARIPTAMRNQGRPPAMRRNGQGLIIGDESEPVPSPQANQVGALRAAQQEAAEVETDGWRLGEGAGLDSMEEARPQQQQQAERPSREEPSPNTLEPMGSGDRQDYERAMTRYRRGDYAGAAAEFERVVQRPTARELLPSAQHHLARSHRRRGACAAAVNHYERLFRLYPAYAQLPQALLEAADCYRRTGRTREARALLHRAAGYNSTADAAQRELRRLDTIDQAQRRSAQSPAQAESFESSY